MWQKFPSHHSERGAVTAVVWGSPGIQGPQNAKDPNVSPDALNAEELTRGRRAEMPFVQQCDLIFPLPEDSATSFSHEEQTTPSSTIDPIDLAGASKTGQLLTEAERRAKAFVQERIEGSFYYRVQGPLSSLLQQPFLRSYVLKGKFYALALNAPSDQGNSFAILPGGILVLSLDRESYQTLGLQGRAARTRPKGTSKRAGAGAGATGGAESVLGGGAGGPDRYVSPIDLSAKSFRPGKPAYDHLMSCLRGSRNNGGNEARSEPEVDMVVCCWEDGGGDIGVPKQRQGPALSTDDDRCAQCAPETSTSVDAEGKDAGSGDHSVNDGTRGGDHGGGSEKETGQSGVRCREVNFPPGFSARKIALEPDIRFFRGACCPDLDFEGQGLAAPSFGPVQGSDDPDIDRTGRAPGSEAENQRQRNGGSARSLLVLDLFEWLGAVSCELVDALLRRGPCPPGKKTSDFETPCHLQFRRDRTICRARLRGLIPPPAVRACVDAASSWGKRQGVTSGHVRDEDPDERSVDGCSWGSVTAWPFRDGPRAYSAAGAPCGGGERSRPRRRGLGDDDVIERVSREWPVGGHGIYSVLSCPGGSAAAFVSARCPGPGW